jgi:type IV secretion system protein VirB10
VVSDERQHDVAPDPIRPASDPIAALRLRPARPRVTRLSRKVLIGGAAIALVAISGAVFWALQNNRHRNAAPEELYSTDHRTTADGLAGLPRDYAGIPRQAPPLGPPLPGDLGRSGGAAACAGDRGGAVEPAVRIDQYPGAAFDHTDTGVGNNT